MARAKSLSSRWPACEPAVRHARGILARAAARRSGRSAEPGDGNCSDKQIFQSPRHLVSVLFAVFVAFATLPLALDFAQAAQLTFPPLTGRVVDDAGVLSGDTKEQLTQILAQEEKQTTNQIVVTTLKSLEGTTIEDYGYQLGRHWGIGWKGKDNGALIIVVPGTHDVRIEVGYGLEGTLTDAATRVVIERYMIPAFRREDYDGGVLAGTNAVLQMLGGVTLSPPQYSGDDQDRQDSGDTPWGFIVLILVWLVFGRFLWPLFFLGALGSGRRYGGGFGGGGFGSGGFGGGGFSGGGGSFGGGGASGHW